MRGSGRATPTGVRYRPDLGFEMRCGDCATRRVSPTYWPLDEECWNVKRGLTRCKACWIAYDRAKHRGRRLEMHEVLRRKEQRYYRENRRVCSATDTQASAARPGTASSAAPRCRSRERHASAARGIR